MQDKINQYIQEQMAKAREARQTCEQAAIDKANQVMAERKVISLSNTLRALNLLGIEAGESELVYETGSDDGLFCGYYFLFGDFRIGLCIDTEYVNVLEESEDLYTETEKANGYQDSYHVDFQLAIYRIIPESLWAEYAEFQSKGGYRHYLFNQDRLKRFLSLSASEESPIKQLPQNEIAKFFDTLVILEAEYQEGFKNWQNWRDGEGLIVAEIANRNAPKPKFSYTGDSREEILAKVLRDIQADYYPEMEF